jgi:hypothetical protein
MYDTTFTHPAKSATYLSLGETASDQYRETVPTAEGQGFRFSVATGELRTSGPIVRDAANFSEQLQVVRLHCCVVVAALNCLGKSAQLLSNT